VSSVALQLLRSLDEMLLKGATHNLTVRTRSDTALYLLNHKRAHLRALEERFRIAIIVNADATVAGQLSFVIEKGEQVHTPEQAKALALQPSNLTPIEEEEEDEEVYEDEVEVEDEAEAVAETESEEIAASDADEASAEGEQGQESGQEAGQEAGQESGQDQGQERKRRRRRRGRRSAEGRDGGAPQGRDGAHQPAAEFAAAGEDEDAGADETEDAGNGAASPEMAGEPGGEAERRRRRRGRRGGRRNRRGREGEGFAAENGGPTEAELEVADLAETPLFDPGPPAMHASAAESWSPESQSTASQSSEQSSDVPPSVESHDERPAQVAVPEAAPTEPPRRRSTVREPVPQASSDHAFSSEEAVPTPAPVPPTPTVEPIVVSSSAEGEANDRPRRAGWWSKRALGKG
jgi:ribonuclease E